MNFILYYTTSKEKLNIHILQPEVVLQNKSANEDSQSSLTKKRVIATLVQRP